MVVGSGMIAKAFSSYASNNEVVIFASGVSNSASTKPSDFHREQELLENTMQLSAPGKLIYFSTCSIYDPSLQDSAYVRHKLIMERLVESTAASYIIFRVSNPIGFTSNAHTVLNYFIEHIKTQSHFQVWKHASRNLLDVEDMFTICDNLINNGEYNNSVINIANPANYPVLLIIEMIEKHFKSKGNYALIEKGSSPLIDTSFIESLFPKLQIEFNNTYLPALLQKYFPAL